MASRLIFPAFTPPLFSMSVYLVGSNEPLNQPGSELIGNVGGYIIHLTFLYSTVFITTTSVLFNVFHKGLS